MVVILLDQTFILIDSTGAWLVFRPRGSLLTPNRVRGQVPLSPKIRASGGDLVIGITCEPTIPVYLV